MMSTSQAGFGVWRHSAAVVRGHPPRRNRKRAGPLLFERRGGNRHSGMLAFLSTHCRGQKTRDGDSHDGAVRAGNQDGAFIALDAAGVADFQSQGAVSHGRLAGLHALAAAVAEGFVDRVFIVIIVGILFIDLAHHTPFESVLRQTFPEGIPFSLGALLMSK